MKQLQLLSLPLIEVLQIFEGLTTEGTYLFYYRPHGMPLDLLDRLLIIHTKPYSDEEIRQIIETRCEEEDVEMTEEALEFLTGIGKDTTLRYAIQLITTSSLLAAKRKSSEVDLMDIRRAFSMFLDVKRSSDYLKDHQAKYLFSEEIKKSEMEA